MAASAHNARTISKLQLALVCMLMLGGVCGASAAVSISGVDTQVRDNILAYLRLDNESCAAPDWRIRRLFAESEIDIRGALEVVGFYNIEIDKQFTTGNTCWQASFAITLGQPVTLRTVSIEIDTGGVQDTVLESVVEECALRTGDVLHHAVYDACRRSITRTAENPAISQPSSSNGVSTFFPMSTRRTSRCISQPAHVMCSAQSLSIRKSWIPI